MTEEEKERRRGRWGQEREMRDSMASIKIFILFEIWVILSSLLL